ncbi:small toxic polypeptide [compost metagenome]
MHHTIKVASYPPKGKKKEAKMPQKPIVWCLLIVCMTVLAFTLLTRNSLCELRIRDGNREVAAILAYESER